MYDEAAQKLFRWCPLTGKTKVPSSTLMVDVELELLHSVWQKAWNPQSKPWHIGSWIRGRMQYTCSTAAVQVAMGSAFLYLAPPDDGAVREMSGTLFHY